VKAFRIVDAEQRSEPWFAARRGKLTGSRADAVCAPKNKDGSWKAVRQDLLVQLACERLTGQVQEDVYINAAMQRGIDCEPLARDAYERKTGYFVQATGFLEHVEHMAGCSLDGHINDFEGIVELKCPKSTTHLRYLRNGIVPSDYIPQLLHNLWISGAHWADFVSFDDRFPPELQVFIVRVEREEREIAEYERKALAFLSEVDIEAAAVATLSNVGAVLREVNA